MKYLIIDFKNLIKHSQSGVAFNKSVVHERRTMNLCELMLIQEGELFVKHLEEYHLVKDDIFFLPEGIEHYGTKPSDCTLHWHHFYLPSNTRIVEKEQLPQVLPKNTIVLPMHFHLKDSKNLSILSYQLEQYSWLDEETQKIRNLLISAIISDIQLEYQKQHSSVSNKRLQSILSYIDNNFQHHPITIKSLSEKFNYNEKYIFNLFKKHLGIPPLQYIIKHRLEEARQMLLNSSCTVESIALTLNYENTQNFFIQFKKHYGMTPTQMRNHYSNTIELHLNK